MKRAGCRAGRRQDFDGRVQQRTENGKDVRRDYILTLPYWLAVRGPSESDELIVGSVGANPIPKDSVGVVFAEGAIMETDTSRPHLAYFLEADGWVPWIGLEKFEVLVGKFTNGFW